MVLRLHDKISPGVEKRFDWVTMGGLNDQKEFIEFLSMLERSLSLDGFNQNRARSGITGPYTIQDHIADWYPPPLESPPPTKARGSRMSLGADVLERMACFRRGMLAVHDAYWSQDFPGFFHQALFIA